MEIFETQDGSHSIFSRKFDVSYHSKYGAIQESRHVFIEAGLFLKAIQKKELHILEMGFGTGLNVLLTWLEAEKLGLKIHYTAVEQFPVDNEIVEQLNYPTLLEADKRKEIFLAFHQSAWEEETQVSENFFLKKLERDFKTVEFPPQFDLVYFDAFAPNVQPELWEVPLMQKMYDALLPGGILVTYCAKGAFKRALKSVGFQVESLQGPPGKREMTRAKKPG